MDALFSHLFQSLSGLLSSIEYKIVKKNGVKKRVMAFYLAGLALAAVLISTPAKAEPTVPCLGNLTCLSQGWNDSDRNIWYRLSQGSRLLPLDWMQALELAGSQEKFLSDTNIKRLGYISEPVSPANPLGLPIGFVVDDNPGRSADLMCETFPATCANKTMRRPWIGMNCSACHTSEVEFNGKTMRVEGAPTLADFQALEEDLLAALKSLQVDAGKFGRFAAAVLATNITPATKAGLKAEINEQVVWQQKLADKNAAPLVRYGHGRLDAQGHILNKVALTTLVTPQKTTVLADAPSSYPFVWNTSQQKKIQWNGIATNTFRMSLFGRDTDVGALIRNVSEVTGVFAHVETDTSKAWRGYSSSADIKNLVALERQLATLQSPRWPEDVLGPLDSAKVTRGDELFDRLGCQSCHAHLDPDDVTTPMAEKMDPINAQKTDIFLACNTFLHSSAAGNFEGQKIFAYTGERIQPVDFTRNMLINTTIGTLVGQLDDLIEASLTDVIVSPRDLNAALVDPNIDFLPGVTSRAKKGMARACLTAQIANPAENILAYKARSLNGIWATAPYLHNGSVPTLYDLLSTSPLKLSSADTSPAPGAGEPLRPEMFGVGSRKFDPVKVGFVTDLADPDNKFTFRVRDEQSGEPIPGNYNSGHDYGTSKLSEAERMDLVEYLKSL